MSTPLLGFEASAPIFRPPLDHGWDRLDMWVVDRHGNRFDVSQWSSGIFFMPGVTGMSKPKVKHQEQEFGNTHGSTWNGLIVEPREVFWPTYLYHDTGSAEYLALIRQWWASLDPWHTVRWHVRDVSGSERYLDVRLQDDGGAGSEYDDSYYGWSQHRIVMKANQPFWRGEVVPREFVQALPVPFFGPDGDNGPPLRPSRNVSRATASIENPGDVPAYPVWTLTGPINPGAEIGYGEGRIVVPFGLTVGQVLVVDTNPEAQTAYRDGVEVTELMVDRFDAVPIPPSADGPADLTVTYGGDGRVRIEIIPQFWRAYA